MPLIILYVMNLITRNTLCRVGQHAKAGGIGFDACSRGCGHVRRPHAAQAYEVILKDGSTFNVNAINEHHAASQVVYGRRRLKINPDATPRGEAIVHRANIISVKPLADSAGALT